MKIINLKSENFKGLKAIDITPTDNMVTISGKNGAGKSSVLDSIFVALCGKPKDMVMPIHEGEHQAEIRVELDDYIVIRKFIGDKQRVEVLSKAGATFNRPQELLDKIVGKIAFDPLSFSNKTETEQRKILIDLVGLNFEEEDAKRKVLYEERLLTGRQLEKMLKPAEYEVKSSMVWAQKEPESLATLTEEYNKASNEHNQYVAAQRTIDITNERIRELEAEINALKARLEELKAVEDTKANIENLQTRMQDAEADNEKIRNAKTIIAANEEVQNHEKAYAEYTEAIKAVDDTKAQILAAAEFPIKGLSIDETCVVFNGIPFKQLSTSEQLKVSMSIAMAMQPEVKVILMKDASLLDADNLKMIREMAGEDYQVWLETVSSDDSVGIYIEDGEVKKINS